MAVRVPERRAFRRAIRPFENQAALLQLDDRGLQVVRIQHQRLAGMTVVDTIRAGIAGAKQDLGLAALEPDEALSLDCYNLPSEDVPVEPERCLRVADEPLDVSDAHSTFSRATPASRLFSSGLPFHGWCSTVLPRSQPESEFAREKEPPAGLEGLLGSGCGYAAVVAVRTHVVTGPGVSARIRLLVTRSRLFLPMANWSID